MDQSNPLSQIYKNNSKFDSKVKNNNNDNKPYPINNLIWQICNQTKRPHYY